ncbi:MAG: hypothetical protein HY606_09110 [Planctomycetes bacterium]|nr:hypothetical protein [Planctomycetota bacterium]
MSDSITRENNLRKILDCISESVASSDARSLWEKIREEMQSGGPDAALQYLNDELTRCKNDFEREITCLRETYSRRRLNE